MADARKGYEHRKRPKTDQTWCGKPWKENGHLSRAKRELCPACRRRSERDKP